MKPKGGEREIDTSYTMSWVNRTGKGGTIVSYPKGQKPLTFPLRVGDTHSHWVEFRAALKGRNAGKTTWKTRVVGWEEVTVPAGKFRALKIESDGLVERYDVSTTFPVKMTG
jgi:hypothetical protein